MKDRLKKTIDVKKTGNKRIRLAEWQEILQLLMEDDGEGNPEINEVPGI